MASPTAPTVTEEARRLERAPPREATRPRWLVRHLSLTFGLPAHQLDAALVRPTIARPVSRFLEGHAVRLLCYVREATGPLARDVDEAPGDDVQMDVSVTDGDGRRDTADGSAVALGSLVSTMETALSDAGGAPPPLRATGEVGAGAAEDGGAVGDTIAISDEYALEADADTPPTPPREREGVTLIAGSERGAVELCVCADGESAEELAGVEGRVAYAFRTDTQRILGDARGDTRVFLGSLDAHALGSLLGVLASARAARRGAARCGGAGRGWGRVRVRARGARS